MAKRKKTSSFVCAVHVIVYLIPFLFTGLVWWKLILIGMQHFAQDRTQFVIWSMKIKGSAGFAEPPLSPWSIILTDNIYHILFIAFINNL